MAGATTGCIPLSQSRLALNLPATLPHLLRLAFAPQNSPQPFAARAARRSRLGEKKTTPRFQPSQPWVVSYSSCRSITSRLQNDLTTIPSPPCRRTRSASYPTTGWLPLSSITFSIFHCEVVTSDGAGCSWNCSRFQSNAICVNAPHRPWS